MNLQENIYRIKEMMGINESTIPVSIRRRANKETLEKYIIDSEFKNPTLCDDFEDGYQYANDVIDDAIDEFLHEIDENALEEEYYIDTVNYLRKLCRDLFEEDMVNMYEITCSEYKNISKKRQEQNESEITERCWKGYTQKGMKTMFGKRYPNCVKK